MGPRHEFHEYVLEGHAVRIEDIFVQVRRLRYELHHALDRIDQQDIKIAELQESLKNTATI
jgi:hypothetical protein